MMIIMGGGRKTLSKYNISFTVKQKPENALKLSEPCRISDIELVEDNKELKGLISLEDNDDNRAIQRAKQKISYLIYALLLLNKTGFDSTEPVIKEKIDGNTINLYANIRAHFSITTTLGIESLNRVSRYVGSLERDVEQEKGHLFRALRWYNRALLEPDVIDKFVDFYITLEILGDWAHPGLKPTERVSKILTELGVTKSDLSKIISLRAKLLHSGETEESLSRYNQITSELIYNGIMKILDKT